MSSIVIKGNTSGQIELAAPDVAGSTTLTLPSGSGNFVSTDSNGDVVISTGDFTVDTNTLHVDATNNRVGIGTSSPATTLDISSSVDPVINVNCSGTGPNTGLSITKEQGSGDLGHWNAININGNDNVSYESRIQWVFDSIANGPVIGGKRTGGGETDLIFHTNSGETLYERVRISSSGALWVGGSTDASGAMRMQRGGAAGGMIVRFNKPNSGATNVILNYYSGTYVGGMNMDNTSTSFVTSSDYRLKENNVNITDGITRVKLLKPYRFNFIADADTTVDGFYAHEVQSVVPEAITGTHNEVDDEGNPVYQGIDQSKLVPLLTAALQEAITKIEDLEARVTALENA